VLAVLCWTKSLLYNVVVFTGIPCISESSNIQSLFIWCRKSLIMTSCKCHKLQEGYFSIQWRVYADSHSDKSDPMFPSRRPSLRVQTLISQQLMFGRGGKTVWTPHQCLETSNYSRLHPSRRNGKSSGCYLEFEKILALQCIRSNNVLYCPNVQLSKHLPSGWRELYARTFLCVEKLRTVSACIHPNVLVAHPDATQCLISYEISFQNTDMGRQLQPSGRCVFPSGRAHS
jgi:hypothetical protein